jgi:hypothetical protein
VIAREDRHIQPIAAMITGCLPGLAEASSAARSSSPSSDRRRGQLGNIE